MSGASSACLAKPVTGHAYVAVHVAFFQDARLSCLRIHQPRVALVRRPTLKFENDSAGKRAGLMRGPPFSLEKYHRAAIGRGAYRPKIEFTGLGIPATQRQRPRVDANVLTGF
jgi:hypothetical protein